MKQIFDWMRDRIDEESLFWAGSMQVNKITAMNIINEAEAQWEAKCCEWKLEDAEANLYVTSCEQRQLIFEGTPRENGYRFCPYCGKKIKEE